MTVRLNDLFDGLTKPTDRVALFLAVLELTKAGRTCISEDGTEIFMKRRNDLLTGKRQRRMEEPETSPAEA